MCAYLMEDIESESREDAERFEVKDVPGANWCMERIFDLRQRIATIERDHEKMVKEYQERIELCGKWRDDSLEEIQKDIDFFISKLSPWARQEIEGGKKKSIKLPLGTVSLKLGKESWTMGGKEMGRGNADLMQFAKKSCPQFIKSEVVETLLWAEMKKTLQATEGGQVCTADGEIIEGAAYSREPDYIVVK